ncbi:hypothetical protein [Legionella jamestowniensis]|uniref:Uncharacterized protein n=1 Tax=Legionella jamestowniensis TaxID=455 RepID=A0A0W0UI83_9GAMM|nr:hypothetical protein [Legionella jamestowniensis]KTD07576.1 hypothetical protein Ljam_1771 [Legionella jamestowniensis]SFM01942.1 hypothetical protein SAMN02746073_3101 [Legionella jamestowniensis DSM 19215]
MPGLEDFYQDIGNDDANDNAKDNKAKQQAPQPKPISGSKSDNKEETTNDLQMKMVKELQNMVSDVNNMLYGGFYDELGKAFKQGLNSGFGLKGKGKKSNNDDDDAPSDDNTHDDIEDMEFGDDIESVFDDDDPSTPSNSNGSGSHDDIEDMEFGEDLESVFDDSPMESMSMDSVSSPTSSSNEGLESMNGLTSSGSTSEIAETIEANPELLALA